MADADLVESIAPQKKARREWNKWEAKQRNMQKSTVNKTKKIGELKHTPPSYKEVQKCASLNEFYEGDSNESV